ncbi:MAG TPA: hypothetical protein VN229_15230, partial [Terriglobales bacterium]|nr:hypothetical protein [Terriglobales bacterium]
GAGTCASEIPACKETVVACLAADAISHALRECSRMQIVSADDCFTFNKNESCVAEPRLIQMDEWPRCISDRHSSNDPILTPRPMLV